MLNPTTVGDAIVAFILANQPTPGTPINEDQLKTLWVGIMTIIYNDLKANAGVAPGTFNVPGFGAVTGVGGPLE